jgi:hypothetical protein
MKTNYLMLYREIIAACPEIHREHVNNAELCYRLRSYRAENTVLCVYVAVHETKTSEQYRRYDLRIFVCYFISLRLTI